MRDHLAGDGRSCPCFGSKTAATACYMNEVEDVVYVLMLPDLHMDLNFNFQETPQYELQFCCEGGKIHFNILNFTITRSQCQRLQKFVVI